MSNEDLGRGARTASGLMALDWLLVPGAPPAIAADSARASYSKKSAECGRTIAAGGRERKLLLLAVSCCCADCGRKKNKYLNIIIFFKFNKN